MTPNRIVAVLTPLVFAPAAGAVSAWVAKHAPGVDLSTQELTNIFIAGALVALAPAAQWLHGWQKYEAREAETERAVAVAGAVAAVASPAYDTEAVEDDGDDYYDELDALEAAGDEDDEDPLIGSPVGAGAEG
jgi:peptidoglycan/LPS O-acetylase OafA/YrhL